MKTVPDLFEEDGAVAIVDNRSNALICPITGVTMTDPVIDHEGNTYEKSAILEWLAIHQVSPITRNRLTPDQLSPNRALRDLLGLSDTPVAKKNHVETKEADVVPNPPRVSLMTSYQKQPRLQDMKKKKKEEEEDLYCLVRVQVNDDDDGNVPICAHAPATIVCVLDVSYSMDDAAVMHDDKEGNAGLSLLDVVKHATRTVIQSLDRHDKLAVVAYADEARVVLPCTNMTPSNRKMAWDAVNSLHTCGSTNLYDGLAKAMDLVRSEQDLSSQSDSNSDSDSDSVANIVLLTDGLPNVHPPRGELETLKRYLDKYPSMRATISTFGFGYNLESKLLRDIAVTGGGHNCFIPDSSFVGTVFINATSNTLSTAQPPCTLDLDTTSTKASLQLQNMSGLSHCQTSWGMSIEIPPLLYGQTLDILIKTDSQQEESIQQIQATLKRGEKVLCEAPQNQRATTTQETDKINLARARSHVVQLVDGAQEGLSGRVGDRQLKSTQTELEELISRFPLLGESDGVKAIRSDLTGQIQEAFSCSTYFNKWGRHYLFSLIRAHILQQCTNFKDPGVQIYATKKFDAIRDELEEVFTKLPPPTPSRAAQARNYTPVRSMGNYYNSSVPCFAAGPVVLADGRVVDVSEICPGDEMMNGGGKVKCVVRTECEGPERLVALDGGVLVTPWHPVKKKGDACCWSFPADLAPSFVSDAHRFVYSFVMEAPAMEIGPYQAVTLGHGIKDDPVAKHDYLGTQRILDDLAKMEGWGDGYVCLSSNPLVRDASTHLITSLRQQIPRRTKDVGITSFNQGAVASSQ